MAQKKVRHAIDEREIVSKHFAHLTRLLRDEEKFQKQSFSERVLNEEGENSKKRGGALFKLVLNDSKFTPSGQRLLSFNFANNRFLPRYQFQVGDVVQLSGFQVSASDRLIGTIYEKNKKNIVIVFSYKLPGWVGTSQHYDLFLSQNQTTYDRMFEALREIGHAEHTQVAYLRNISLGLRKARFRDPVAPEAMEFFNEQLNDLQKLAVCKAQEIEDVLLIHGPPGTGKTSVLIEIIRQARQRKESVLVSAPSNAACDHLVNCLVDVGVPVTRLGHPARVTDKLREHTLSYKMVYHPFAKLIHKNESRIEQLDRQRERRQDRRTLSWEEKKEMREEFRALRQEIRQLRADIFSQVWNVADVVVATHTVCADSHLKGKAFDWVILDEATQSVEPATWIPAAHAGKVILAGDHHQLPPTVFSPKKGPNSLSYTVFERLHKNLEEGSKIRLETQYRMHESIMKFSSQEFYEEQLVAADLAKTRLLADLEGFQKNEVTTSPIIFLDTAGLGYEEKIEPGSESRFNPEEAKLVKIQYDELIHAGLPEEDIAVISPYSAQVKCLAGLLQIDEWGAEEGTGPDIDSVDAFQGQEREAVIVSLVRANLEGSIGFLGDVRRMNVALTRAKRKLIVIGDSATLSSLPFYANFISYVESVNGYRSAWEYVS